MTKDYKLARKDAQEKADLTGHDYGIELNSLFKTYSVFILPQRKNRCGHELRCEVVHPQDLSKCLPGHGPVQS